MGYHPMRKRVFELSARRIPNRLYRHTVMAPFLNLPCYIDNGIMRT